MNRVRRFVSDWQAELLAAGGMAVLLVLGSVSLHADTQQYNQVCTGTTCSATGACPGAGGCTSPNAGCGSYLFGNNLPTCQTGNSSQYCNIPTAPATCSNLCQCFCQQAGWGWYCIPTYDGNGNPVCSAYGTNGYCNNPPP